MFEIIFKYQFIQNAIIASVLSSIICGIIGVIITEKKLVMMSGGVAHTAYGGVGLGHLLGFEPMLGAILFSIFGAFSIGFIQKRSKLNADIIIGFLWSLGMALGIIFVALAPGYPPSLESYLFGNVLSVKQTDIRFTLYLTAFIVIAIVIFFQDWKSYLFDSQFAWINGLNTTFFEYFMLVLISLSIVSLIHLVGIILVISLLTAPAASASLFTNSFAKRMLIATFIGVFNCLSGLYISYAFKLPTGAIIICTSIIVYTVLLLVSKLKKANKKSD